MKRRIVLGILAFLVLECVFILGMLCARYQIFPYRIVNDTIDVLDPNTAAMIAIRAAPQIQNEMPVPQSPLEYSDLTTVAPVYYETDVNQLISMHTAADANAQREKLITFLWGTPTLPARSDVTVIPRYIDPRYTDIDSLKRIEKLTVSMEYGLESRFYHFIPEHPTNTLVLYHQGHAGDFFISKEQIKQLLDDGCDVVAFCMPLLGINNNPVVTLPRIGRLKLTLHDQLKYLTPSQGHPIKYFVEPVVVTLNYLQQHSHFTRIAMMGISGGGWTTTLAAAIDPRIRFSFPVAGSYPLYLRSECLRDRGDWEQTTPALYQNTTYLEMYILGAYGKGRKQIQIINQQDPACFGGIKWQTYYEPVRQRVQALGSGEYDLFMDTLNKSHSISGDAINMILTTLRDAQ